MTQILRRPFSDKPTEVSVAGERILVRAHQMIVWVSLTPHNAIKWDERTPPLPAILDTGHSHNLSIREDHLLPWAHIPSEVLPISGRIRDRGMRVPLRNAGVWLHRNQPSARDVLIGHPVQLQVPAGIAVCPTGSEFPRLPLLGLRAITVN